MTNKGSSEETYQSDYRNQLATADKQGRRIWVFPTKPKGKLYTARTILSWFLLAFLFGAPFIKVGGHPLLLFDILNRKFVIFGLVFWPQDFHLFVLATITLAVFIVLFTAVFGRLFCGWICPQTIFMEMVFRKIEYFIEGNAGSQRRLAAAPWTVSKIFKKSTKQLIFFGISFLIGNTFLAYIIGVDALYEIITAPPSEHIGGLVAMLLFSGMFYFVFAWFREQACTLVCPYGRLQSVLLDNNSIVIAYDYKRGEKRAPAARNEDFSNRGHCIACNACVKVCPTGIDIRNGTQLECVNCTACIDACNNVMHKLDLPPGLIRYASGNNIEKNEKFRFTGRIIGYMIALTFLVTLMTVLLLMRNDIEASILRTPGTLYEETNNGLIRNLYNVKLVNKSNETVPVYLKLKRPSGHISLVGDSLVIPPDGLTESVFFIEINKKQLFSPNSLVEVEVYSGDELIETVRTSFMGPKPGFEPDDDHNDGEEENYNDGD